MHGALAFYLANQRDIDAYLLDGQRTAESHHAQSKQTNAELIAKLQRARNCESDSRLMPIWMGASSGGCAESHRKSTFRPQPKGELVGLDDLEVLRIAADCGRILVSQDRRTMPRHFVRFSQSARSPGVILLREAIPIATASEELVLIWNASKAEEWQNRLVWIPL